MVPSSFHFLALSIWKKSQWSSDSWVNLERFLIHNFFQSDNFFNICIRKIFVDLTCKIFFHWSYPPIILIFQKIHENANLLLQSVWRQKFFAPTKKILFISLKLFISKSEIQLQEFSLIFNPSKNKYDMRINWGLEKKVFCFYSFYMIFVCNFCFKYSYTKRETYRFSLCWFAVPIKISITLGVFSTPESFHFRISITIIEKESMKS